MIEIPRAETWLYGQLQGLADGRVYSAVAPQEAAFPLIVYQFQGGYDVRGVGPARIWASLLFLVKAIGQDEKFGPLIPLADQIDQQLQGMSGATPDGQVLTCIREQPFALVEVPSGGGTQYRHLGGIYRLAVQPR